MACRHRVEVRESTDLTAPATAGWRSHVILLPEDWRSWDDDERRAVLAHELRISAAMIISRESWPGPPWPCTSTTPWCTGWLPVSGWSKSWPPTRSGPGLQAGGPDTCEACRGWCCGRLDVPRAGRPGRSCRRGSLIRRIAMLREETKALDRPWSRRCRALAASLLVAVGAGASLLHGPALADDPDGPTASGTKSVLGKLTGEGIVPESSKPFDLSYVTDDDSQAIVAFRPAAAFRRSGMGVYRTMLNVWIGQQWAKAATALKFDPTQPGQKPLTVDLFEEVSASVRIFRTKGPKPDGRFAWTMFTVRTTEPVDWVALLRIFKMDVIEATRRRSGLLPVEG